MIHRLVRSNGARIRRIRAAPRSAREERTYPRFDAASPCRRWTERSSRTPRRWAVGDGSDGVDRCLHAHDTRAERSSWRFRGDATAAHVDASSSSSGGPPDIRARCRGPGFSWSVATPRRLSSAGRGRGRVTCTVEDVRPFLARPTIRVRSGPVAARASRSSSPGDGKRAFHPAGRRGPAGPGRPEHRDRGYRRLFSEPAAALLRDPPGPASALRDSNVEGSSHGSSGDGLPDGYLDRRASRAGVAHEERPARHLLFPPDARWCFRVEFAKYLPTR